MNKLPVSSAINQDLAAFLVKAYEMPEYVLAAIVEKTQTVEERTYGTIMAIFSYYLLVIKGIDLELSDITEKHIKEHFNDCLACAVLKTFSRTGN